MAEIEIDCPHCNQHIECDESYRGMQINCPTCKQLFLIPQAEQSVSPPPPVAPVIQIRRTQSPVNMAAAREAEIETDTPALWNPVAAGCLGLGLICYGFGLVDFAGIVFGYDITGVSWSPIVAAVVGSTLLSSGRKLNKNGKPISTGVVIAAFVVVGLLSVSSIIYCASNGNKSASITDLEADVKTNIQDYFNKNHITVEGTQIDSLSLVHENGNKYKGILTARTGSRTETAEVDVTYDGKKLIWKILPTTPSLTSDNPPESPQTVQINQSQQQFAPASAQPEVVQSDWNRQEVDAAKNGNIAVAVQKMLANPQLRNQATAQNPQMVAKTVYKYLGQVVKFTGNVGVVQDYPAGSDNAIAGNESSDIVIETSDGTIVEMFCMKSTGSMQIGDVVNLYGYPVGILDVPNRLGGNNVHLILVGNDYDNRRGAR